MALFLLAGCGPGAGDRRPLGAEEAEPDIGRNAIWAAEVRLGAMLDGEWRCELPCADPGVHPSVLPSRFGGKVQGTYGPAGDGDVMEFVWTGAVPRGVSTIAIPVVAGPDPAGTTVRVMVDGHERAKLQATPPEWRAWRVHVIAASGSRRVRIEVKDSGRGFGQWVAISSPYVVE